MNASEAGDHHAEDRLELVDDEVPAAGERELPSWKILIVDDDEQVHGSTEFALRDVRVLGRPLRFLNARSALEARRILAAEEDIAVVFLDVVMEEDDAGLRLVRVIREDLGLTELRIILRTGQPGYAPELEAVRDYDINDYRTKADLTRTRLVTSLTSAIRSYDQIRTIAASRRGLEKIVGSAAELFKKRAVESLAEGALTQIAGLLGVPASGVVCAQRGFPLDGSDPERLYVVGAVGPYAHAMNRPLDTLGDPRIEAAIRGAMLRRRSIHASDHSVLYLNSDSREEAVFLDSGRPLALMDRQLLEVFAANISVGFSNVYLFNRLNYLAYHDPVTDLPNRRGLADIADGLRRRGGEPFRAILVDIDHFTSINEALGSRLGDSLLQAVARRLRERLPERVHIGRYGADEICVIGGVSELAAERVQRPFAEPFEIAGYVVPLSVTLGECPGSIGASGMEVLENASLAVSLAKRGARGRCLSYTEGMARDSRERLGLLQKLRRAVHDGSLALHYQPQLSLDDGTVVGAEALLRWRGDAGEVAPPGVFVPLAESSGLIVEIGEWVMAEACRQLARWNALGLAPIRVSINVSPQQLRFSDCAAVLERAMRSAGVDGSRLRIEITESVLMDDATGAREHLDRIRCLGVSIALDDFGTGFSSLSYLQQLPIDVLKVDGAFVREAGRPGRGEHIAQAIVDLARLLQLQTVAEGVETEVQARAARQWGCSIAQGFLYAPALEPASFPDWVRGRAAAR